MAKLKAVLVRVPRGAALDVKREPCSLCGSKFGTGELLLELRGDNVWFLVCRECAGVNSAAAAERGRWYAAHLRDQAADVERLAEAVTRVKKWNRLPELASGFDAELDVLPF